MSDIELSQLRSIREDFIRIDTLCAANDIVSNHIHSRPIFKQWNLMNEKVLADAHGQNSQPPIALFSHAIPKSTWAKGEVYRFTTYSPIMSPLTPRISA
ncbi:Tn3 family transposase, partial [Thalassotalea sp. G20_0]|uniref:Tn3 family transposase n=1 Tax=Thalassotalea sp. G20_0 TaxID=2821093 RepID=UPI001ADAB5E8